MNNIIRAIFLLLYIPALVGCGAFEGTLQTTETTTHQSLMNSAYIENQVGLDYLDQPQRLNTVVREDVPTPENIDIRMEPIKKCQAGEVDIIKLSLFCQPESSLILTLQDAQGERLVENFGNLKTSDSETIINRLKKEALESIVYENDFELFLCLDHDSDNSCTDEQIIDLNEMNGDVLYSVLALNKISQNKSVSTHTKKLKNLCENSKLSNLSKGLLIFHQRFQGKASEVQASRVNVHALTADKIAKYVKNFSEETEVGEYQSGTELIFKLVEADKAACKEITTRIHGCFAKGTQIQVSKNSAMAIEDLQVGHSVLRSNGTQAKITKIVQGPEKKPMIEISLKDGSSVMLTESHPVWTKKGVITAKALSITDKLLTQKGDWQPLASLKAVKYKDLVYNISLSGSEGTEDHLLISNNIVTGDLFLQNSLTEKKKENLSLGMAD